jgi:hypothetical protein
MITRWDFIRRVEAEINDGPIAADVRFTGYSDPGRLYGPVDLQYPPEGDDTRSIAGPITLYPADAEDNDLPERELGPADPLSKEARKTIEKAAAAADVERAAERNI